MRSLTFPGLLLLLRCTLKLAGMSSMVWLRKGKGEMILFAFNPQFRAATPVANKLLFNSILPGK